jgi:hypothetical protein
MLTVSILQLNDRDRCNGLKTKPNYLLPARNTSLVKMCIGKDVHPFESKRMWNDISSTWIWKQAKVPVLIFDNAGFKPKLGEKKATTYW